MGGEGETEEEEDGVEAEKEEEFKVNNKQRWPSHSNVCPKRSIVNTTINSEKKGHTDTSKTFQSSDIKRSCVM